VKKCLVGLPHTAGSRSGLHHQQQHYTTTTPSSSSSSSRDSSHTLGLS
jgi:hypothetical protein